MKVNVLKMHNKQPDDQTMEQRVIASGNFIEKLFEDALKTRSSKKRNEARYYFESLSIYLGQFPNLFESMQDIRDEYISSLPDKSVIN